MRCNGAGGRRPRLARATAASGATLLGLALAAVLGAPAPARAAAPVLGAPAPARAAAAVHPASARAGRLEVTAARREQGPSAPGALTYAYGSNDDGQLGDGTTSDSSSPVAVSAPAGVSFTALAAGGAHTLALGSDGNVYAWGFNGFGQLGNGTTTSSDTPVVVSLPAGTYTALAAGADSSYALSSNGTLFAWGTNGSGQLGDGSTASSDIPRAVSAPPGVTFDAVAAGAFHALALSSSGSVYAWGSDASDQLGPNATGTETSPVAVTLPVSATALAGGGQFSLALGSDGNIYAWGQGQSGELGDGGSVDQATPVTVTKPNGVSAFSALSAGNESAEALATSTSGTGQLYTWGDNELGQLGTASAGTCAAGVRACSTTPVQPADTNGHHFAAIAMGYAQGYAVTTAGLAEAWGDDFYGQLGVGSSGSIVPTPVAVPLPAGINASQLPSGPAASFGFLLSGDPQSITVPTVGPVTYGSSPVAVTATASSGLATTMGAGPPTVCDMKVAGLVQVLGVGQCVVSATQAGDATYDPATGTGGFMVQPAPLTLTASNVSAPYGDVPTTFASSLSGFVDGDTVAVMSGAAACTTAANDASPVGTYPITCAPGSLQAADYVVAEEVPGTLTVVSGVAVTAVAPVAGPASGGNTVTITGPNLSPVNQVLFGSAPATGIVALGTDQLQVTAPAHSYGTVNVVVSGPSGTSPTSATDHYDFVRPPTVSSVSPDSGPDGGGTTITVTGTNLGGTTEVDVGGAAATGVVVVSPTQVEATTPPGSGTVDVTVTAAGGTSATGPADQFTYLPPQRSPRSARAAARTAVARRSR